MMTPDTTPTTTTGSDVSRVVRVGDQTVALYRQDPKHVMPRVFISDTAYAEAITGMVIVCTDVVLLNRERQTFYLATRRSLPMRGLWWIGGRMNAGETERESIMRAFRRETGLELPAGRFVETPRMTRYQWSERQQVPQTLGSDNLCYNYSLELSGEELAHVAAHLDPNEYDQEVGLREFTRAELKAIYSEGRLHPVIWDIYQTIFGY